MSTRHELSMKFLVHDGGEGVEGCVRGIVMLFRRGRSAAGSEQVLTDERCRCIAAFRACEELSLNTVAVPPVDHKWKPLC